MTTFEFREKRAAQSASHEKSQDKIPLPISAAELENAPAMLQVKGCPSDHEGANGIYKKMKPTQGPPAGFEQQSYYREEYWPQFAKFGWYEQLDRADGEKLTEKCWIHFSKDGNQKQSCFLNRPSQSFLYKVAAEERSVIPPTKGWKTHANTSGVFVELKEMEVCAL